MRFSPASIDVKKLTDLLIGVFKEWFVAENGASVLFAILGLLMRVPIVSYYVPASGTVSASFWLMAGLLGLYFVRGEKIDLSLAPILLFSLYAAFISCVSGHGSFQMLFVRIASIAGAALFAFSERDNFIKTGSLFSVLLFGLLILDILTILLVPEGLYDTGTGPSWIMGYKNLRTEFFILLIVVSAVLFFKSGSKRHLAFLIASFGVSSIDLLLCDCSSGVGGLAVQAVLIGVVYFLPRKTRYMRCFWVFLVVYLALFFLLVVFRENTFVSTLMATVFGKTATLSGRTYIWDSCLFAIEGTNWLGLGAITATDYYATTGGFYNAHNYIVDLALLGGIPAVALMFAAIGMKISKAKDSRENMVIVSSVYAILVISVVSGVFTYSPLFYFLVFSIASAETKTPDAEAAFPRKRLWKRQLLSRESQRDKNKRR